MRTFMTIDEIRTATEDGSFDENHYLEAKTLLKVKSKTDKDELARDLAQFAFDGGTVVFGVKEDKSDHGNQFSLAPVELATNVREQIEQIAHERCQPPLALRVRELVVDQEAATGYIVVEIMPSSRLPHMVDGKYPFRGDSTRRFLSDSEVRMWIAHSEDLHERVDHELRELVERDPIGDRVNRAGHLFGVAIPLTSRQDELPKKYDLQPWLGSAIADFEMHWRDNFRAADPRSRGTARSTALSTVGSLHPRSSEYALRSQALSDLESGRDSDPVEENLAEWSVDVAGAIRIYDAGLSTYRKPPGEDEIHVTWNSTPVELLGILVESARISGERLAYNGQWGFGIAWTGLRGARLNGLDSYRTYPYVDRGEGTHLRVTSSIELQENPAEVLVELARPLLRMLGDEDYLFSL